ncbi:MAG: choice-of-anchor L domain-containing protein [Xanthomarina sp.]
MKKLLSLYIILSGCISYAQIIHINNPIHPESSYSLQQLVEEVLISGDCADVDNFSTQAFGAPNQTNSKSYGYFKKPEGSTFDFDEGIVLTTGRAYPAGNNVSNSTIDYSNNLPGDTDLQAALNINNTRDATYVKFTFVPTSPDFSFDFIMASEEYDGDFECSYSDSFAFLLREVGTNAYTNLAVLPNGQPVSVTNINNAAGCAANVDFFAGYNLPHTNYGGQTKKLTASTTVVPNQAYEIKLVLADQGDSQYDSAIFLEAGSFNIGLDLGQDLTIATGNPACSVGTLILDTQIPASSNTPHIWFFNDVEIVGKTGSTLEVTEAGTYSVFVDYGANCTASDSVIIEFTASPVANPIADLIGCDEDNDGFTEIDLTLFNEDVLGTQLSTSFTVSYHTSQTDADTNSSPISSLYINQVANQTETIFARIESNQNPNCFDSTSFLIDIILNPNLNLTPLPIEACEMDTGQYDSFNLTERENSILNGLNSSDFLISYYENEQDALEGNIHTINNPLVFANTQPFSQIIYVRVQPTTSHCSQIIPLSLIVNPSPEIALEKQYIICLDAMGQVIDPVNKTILPKAPIDTQLSEIEYTFQWYYGEETDNNNLISGAIQSTYLPTAPGFYTVNAASILTGCTFSGTTEVIDSYPPESITAQIHSQSFSNSHSIEVTVVGLGNYQISLDNGPWQSDTTFENVSGAEHLIRVRDFYNCNELIYELVVIDYPRFFTPNNDGYNDTWNLYGMQDQKDAKISIYNRYGKLLKQLRPNETGWDGTLYGEPLPTNDYWFVVEYIEPTTAVKKTFKAHFTLKR